MLVLDTNMLSEIMRPEPERRIADWLLRQPSDGLFTAAVCQAEFLSGPATTPSGRRRADLEEAARATFADDFDGRILPSDNGAASAYAEVFTARRKVGRPSGTIDLMLAAIARAGGKRCHPQRGRFRGLGSHTAGLSS